MKELAVFYHLFIPDTTESWVWWVDEQMGLLQSTGLADRAKVFLCTTLQVGLKNQFNSFTYDEMVLNYIKEHYPFVNILDVRGCKEDPNLFEGQTIKQLWEYCKTFDGYVLYFHNKGMSSYGTHVPGALSDWKKLMHYFNIEKWENCVAKLDEGYDACGINFLKEENLDQETFTEEQKFLCNHFAGNFWWMKASHARTLPDPLELEKYSDVTYMMENLKTYRYAFEVWIGHGCKEDCSNYYTFHQSNTHHYFEFYPRTKYAEEDNIIIREKIKTKKPLTVFYHLFIPNTSGMWIWWIDEQLGLIEKSGLSINSTVNICITLPLGLIGEFKVGKPDSYKQSYDDMVVEYINHRYPFVNILGLRDINEHPNIFEGQTLKEVYSHSLKNDGYVLYLHNKGMTENFYNTWGVFGEDHRWRRYMQEYCIGRWKECVEKLDEGFDAVGANYYEDFYPFAGNFWWATSEHIKRLGNPLDVDKYYHDSSSNYRYAFERWVGTKEPKIHYMDIRPKKSGEVQKFRKTYVEEKPMNLNSYITQPKNEKFNMVRIVPDNGYYVHAQVFHEIEAAMFFALKSMGYDVTNSINDFAPDAKNIIFGMQHCKVDTIRHDVPKNSIVYSLEQMRDTPECIRWCRKYRGLEVWDYSKLNVETLKLAGVENIKVVPIGYVPEISYIERQPLEKRDIDILAYMSPSPRRRKIMDQFGNNPNINFVHLEAVYGEERDAAMARAKLIINLHNYDNKIFEMVRITHALQQGIPILAERGPDTDFPEYMEDTVNLSTYNRFVDTAYKLLKKPEDLEASAVRALDKFKQTPMTKFLEEALK